MLEKKRKAVSLAAAAIFMAAQLSDDVSHRRLYEDVAEYTGALYTQVCGLANPRGQSAEGALAARPAPGASACA